MKPVRARRAPADWSVYIVRCGDDSLYTGVAKDVAARVAALSREAAVKRLPRPLKQALAKGRPS